MTSAMDFKKTVSGTHLLKTAWQPGLQALRAEDKPHIDVEDPRRLTGSVDIDAAYLSEDPYGNRWDFAIGYRHTNSTEEVIYWVELHTGSDSEIKAVIKKAHWLLAWFKGHGKKLAAFEREILWVSSGATRLSPSAPRKKQMAMAGLRQVGGQLRITNQRKN
jgi:hypothetical protein